jgi:hypothetical protein
MTITTLESLQRGCANLRSMIKHCQEQQRIQNQPDALVTFVRSGEAKGAKSRLFATRGPYGAVLTVREGETVLGFAANTLLDFLEPALETMLKECERWSQ